MKKLVTGLTVLACLCLLTGAASAAEFEIEAHGAGQHAYDASFNAFGSGGTPNVFLSTNVGVGYHIGELFGLDGLYLYGVVGRESAENSRFDGSATFGWDRTLVLAGAEYGLDVGPYFRPFLRATVGLAHQRVTLAPGDGALFKQSRLNVATRPSAGLQFHTPFAAAPDSQPTGETGHESPLALSQHFSIGLTLESGYLWQPTPDFDNLTAVGADAGSDSSTTYPRSGVDLGPVNASGWFWAVGAKLRFRL